ncbi:uncharacterized protein DS421_13g415640 [Arachis hypogaea]|nr:uncharacterized protein DS421_13g415640 [Arachis hypogaea]
MVVTKSEKLKRGGNVPLEYKDEVGEGQNGKWDVIEKVAEGDVLFGVWTLVGVKCEPSFC